jgi:excisionase family DNA binding protein
MNEQLDSHHSIGFQSRRILNAREAAEFLGISKNTLYRMEKEGYIIPFRTPGGHRRYEVKMLETYLENSRRKSPSSNRNSGD